MLEFDRLPKDLVRELEELLNSTKTSSGVDERSQVPKFPISNSDEGVFLRQKACIQNARQAQSMSSSDQFLCNRTDEFFINGIKEIRTKTENLRIGDRDKVKYEKGKILIVRDGQMREKVINDTDRLVSATVKSKCEVELKDVYFGQTTFIFESSKSLKNFMSNEAVSQLLGNKKKSTTEKLKWLLGKRSSREYLERRGIYKSEPIFGNSLQQIFESRGRSPPEFLLKVISLIELPENKNSIGVYRTSGNLATIQKIRFDIDLGKLSVLDEYRKDVDVLTGTLKLFFRELNESLINKKMFYQLTKFLNRSIEEFTKSDIGVILSCVRNMPEAHQIAFGILVRHLLEIAACQHVNKMDESNLAICWGPSLIFYDEVDLGKDIITQTSEAGKVVELLLKFYRHYPLLLKNNEQQSPILTSQEDSNCATIKKIIEHIEKDIELEGLYQKPGSSSKTEKLYKKIAKQKGNLSQEDLKLCDILEWSTVLKKFIKDMKDPLIPTIHESRGETVESILERVPVQRKDTLLRLLTHLSKLVDKQPKAKDKVVKNWSKVLNIDESILVSLLGFVESRKAPSSPHLLDVKHQELVKHIKEFKAEKSLKVKSVYDNLDDGDDGTEKGENTKL